jgi:hypothetical protein
VDGLLDEVSQSFPLDFKRDCMALAFNFKLPFGKQFFEAARLEPRPEIVARRTKVKS